MTHKEALKRALKELIQARINLDHGQKNGVPPEQMAALREKVEYRETVVEALRLIPHGEPLILEQLREKIEEVVWIEVIDAPKYNKWAIVDTLSKYAIEFTDGDLKLVSEYGKTWLAYAYPPAHIDRAAWEPCYFCKTEKCFNCRHDDLSLTDEPCNSCVGDKWEPQYKFCPKCGRPFMTEAWSMLEKRLRG